MSQGRPCSHFPFGIEAEQGVDSLPDGAGGIWFVCPEPARAAIAGFVEVLGQHHHALPGSNRHGVGVVMSLGQVLVLGGAGGGSHDQRVVVEVDLEVGFHLFKQLVHGCHLLSLVRRMPYEAGP